MIKPSPTAVIESRIASAIRLPPRVLAHCRRFGVGTPHTIREYNRVPRRWNSCNRATYIYRGRQNLEDLIESGRPGLQSHRHKPSRPVLLADLNCRTVDDLSSVFPFRSRRGEKGRGEYTSPRPHNLALCYPAIILPRPILAKKIGHRRVLAG